MGNALASILALSFYAGPVSFSASISPPEIGCFALDRLVLFWQWHINEPLTLLYVGPPVCTQLQPTATVGDSRSLFVYYPALWTEQQCSTQLNEHVRTQVLTPQCPHLFNTTTYETTHLLLQVLIYLQFRSGRLCNHTRHPGASKTCLNML